MNRYPVSSLLGATTVFLFSRTASAETVPFSNTVPLQATDYSENFTLPQFNPNQGIFQNVEILLQGQVEGNASYENRSHNPATITLKLLTGLTLTEQTTSTMLATFDEQ